MISAKPMAVVTLLALAGGAVAQEKVDEQRTLPRAIELLDDLPRHELRDPMRDLIQFMRAHHTFRAKRARRSRSSVVGGVGIAEGAGSAEAWSARDELGYRRAWHEFQSALALDYKRIRQEGGSPSIPMMQLLLLAVLKCANPDAPFLEALTKEERSDLADALLLVAETQEESLLAHLYKLHEGDTTDRIRRALLLGQMKDLATDVTPHLIEELAEKDRRVVQEAITALGMIGPAAKDAIPTLEKLTEHEDPQIAQRAKAALRQVRGR